MECLVSTVGEISCLSGAPNTSKLKTTVASRRSKSNLPALFGQAIGELRPLDKKILFGPERQAGLGIRLPTTTAKEAYRSSEEASAHLSQAIFDRDLEFEMEKHKEAWRKSRSGHETRMAEELNILREEVNNANAEVDISPNMKTTFLRFTENDLKSPYWLNVPCVPEMGFRLSKYQFIDGISMRYGMTAPDLRDKCPCGEDFDMGHAMGYNTGNVVVKRHDEMRDVMGDLSSQVWNAAKEPMVKEGTYAMNEETGTMEMVNALRADLGVQGLQNEGMTTFLDFSVVDTNAASAPSSARAALNRRAAQKIQKYRSECQKKGGLFMPFVVSAAEATLHPTAQQVMQTLSNALARKWKENRGKVRSWVHTRLAFCIIRGSSNCLRSQKYSWNKAGLFIYGWGHTRPSFLER